jgi:hypothetical protein
MYRDVYSFALLASLLNLLNLCAAQDANPITQPKKGRYLKPGLTYDILWNVTKPDILDIISIELMCDLNISTIFPGNPCLTPDPTCIELVSNISNTGNWTWKIPANAPQSNSYYLDIFVPDPPPGGPYYFMTGNFSINATDPAVSALIVPPKTATATSTSAAATATASILSPAQGPSNGIALKGTKLMIASSGSGLSTAAIGGIIGALVGACLLIAFIVTLITLRRKTRYQAAKNLRISRIVDNLPAAKDEPPTYGKATNKEEIEMVEERSEVVGRIRYPDPDEMGTIAMSGRLRSDQRI